MDAYTLHIALAFVSAIMTISLLGLYIASPREYCLFDWSVAGMLFLAANGMCYLVFHHMLPFLLVPALLNVCYLTGHAVILLGVRRYLGLKPYWKLVPIFALVIFSLHMLPWVQASVANRMLVLYPIIMLMNGLTASVLWCKADAQLKLACMPLMVLEFLFMLQLMVRTMMLVFEPDMPLTYAGSQILQTSGTLAVVVFLSLGTMACALMVFRRQEVVLRQLTTTDPLTGWLNRRALEEIAMREFERSVRTATPMNLLMLDIDHFKKINDTHGHICGDAVIRHITGLSAEVLRGYDYLFRYGGEEFVVLLPEIEDIALQNLANRLRLKIQGSALIFEGKEVPITVSIGFSTLQTDDADWCQLLKRADAALYHAKQDGRDRVGYYKGTALAVIC
jgi:diguanylate cyclase (GGDEF)-like protein